MLAISLFAISCMCSTLQDLKRNSNNNEETTPTKYEKDFLTCSPKYKINIKDAIQYGWHLFYYNS